MVKKRERGREDQKRERRDGFSLQPVWYRKDQKREEETWPRKEKNGREEKNFSIIPSNIY